MPSYSPIPPTSPYPRAAAASTVASMSSTSKQTLRMPSWLAGGSVNPGTWSGVTNRATSSQVPPSAPGRFSPTTSVFDPGMPQTVSMNSPSTNCRPTDLEPEPLEERHHRLEVVHRDPDMVEPLHVSHARQTDHPPPHFSSVAGASKQARRRRALPIQPNAQPTWH